MHDLPLFRLKIHRVSIAAILAFALSACGGGSSGTGSEPDNNDQPNSSDPDSNDQAPQSTPLTLEAPDLFTLPNSGRSYLLETTVSEPENVQISWSIDSSPNNGNLVLNPTFYPWDILVSATVEGTYTVSVQASDGVDTINRTIQIEVSNQPPPILGLTITPEVPTVNSYGSARFDNSDHVHEYYTQVVYNWRVNGNLVDWNSAYPDFQSLNRGDRLTIEVIATRGETVVTATSPEVIIANAPPNADRVQIEPLVAGAGDDLNIVVAGLYDGDGDQISTAYQWFLNDEPIAGQTNETLPAGFASAEDRVRVDISLSDGFDSVTVASSERQLINTPSLLVVDPAPLVINYGSPASFNVKFVDPDGEAVQTEFDEGPEGLTYDAANQIAYWTPTPTMLADQEIFYAYFNSSDDQREAVQISVRNEQNNPVLARSGIYIPDSDFELDIGDFDGDGRSEVLSTNSQEHIFTLEYDGESITQDWLYPFAIQPGEPVLRLWAYGADLSQILVVTSNGVSLIHSRTQLPQRLLDTDFSIAAAAFEDFDRNGNKELLLINTDGEMSKLNLGNGTLSTFGETLSATEWPTEYYSIAVGNVDTDPALEIVVDSGQVIDGASGSIEWTHHTRFGNNITIGDVDGDGDIDIVAADRWENVTSYDPIAKTSIWTYNINDFCGLRLYNIDADPQDELIAGPCQHRALEIYDGSSGSMVLEDSIASEYYNSSLRSFSLGDIDDDGVEEIIFSTGSGSTASDNMAVVSLPTLGDSSEGALVNINPSQILGFKSIGWDQSTEQTRAVFILPETEGGDYVPDHGNRGLRLGLFSPSGDVSVSDILASNWNRLAAGVVVDSNADGISEAVVAVGEVFDGEVHHLNLNNFALTHTHTDLRGTEQYSRPEILSMSLGIDSDGSPKTVIATDELKLQVYDIASRQSSWTSGGLSGGQMVGAATVNGTSGFAIAAATTSELTLWRKSADGSYAKTATAVVECHSIEHVVNGSEDQIACVQTDRWEDSTTISLFNQELVKQTDLHLNFAVTAITSSSSGELYIGAKEEVESSSFFFDGVHTLRKINADTGAIIWESAPLLGEINAISFTDTEAGGESKMAISTSSAMYIVE